MHVAAHADHDGAGILLGQDPGELAVVDHHVVRPLETGFDAAELADRRDAGEARGHRHQRQRLGRERGAKERRDEERRTRRRDPRPAEAAATRRLLVGDGDRALRRALPCGFEQVAVRRVDRREPPDIREASAIEPHIAPDGMPDIHESQARTLVRPP